MIFLYNECNFLIVKVIESPVFMDELSRFGFAAILKISIWI